MICPSGRFVEWIEEIGFYVHGLVDENFCDGGRSMRGFNPSGKSPAVGCVGGLRYAGACEEHRPHPEELAKQASRRMDTTHGLAAILRDARKGALLRMRSEKYFTTAFAGDDE